ncbi:hypothetical protein ACU8KH_01234 [Lachancea thermotolerans]
MVCTHRQVIRKTWPSSKRDVLSEKLVSTKYMAYGLLGLLSMWSRNCATALLRQIYGKYLFDTWQILVLT